MLFSKDIGIDLGTANVLIYEKGKGIVLEEPSVVSMDAQTGRMIAAGEEARQMLGRTPGKIEVVRPMKDGVIADIAATEMMLKHFINSLNIKGMLSQPRIMICCPTNITLVEKNAIREAAEKCGAREVFIEEEPKIAALGAGMDISKPSGNMVIDVGGGTADIAVLSLGDIVTSASIKIAGNRFDQDIVDYIKTNYKLLIGDRTAEEIKIHVGSALSELDEPPADFVVQGPNQMTSLPVEVPVSYQEIAHCIEKSISKIEIAILAALEQTPPELYADIVNKGIYLAGGGALLRGLDKRLTDKLNIPFHIAEDPLRAVARGTGIALKNVDRFSFLIR